MLCFLVPCCATVLWSQIFCGPPASHSPIWGQLAPCFNPESTAPYEPKSSKLTDLARVTCSLLRVGHWALRPHPRLPLSGRPLCGDSGVRSGGATALPQLQRAVYQSRSGDVTWQTYFGTADAPQRPRPAESPVWPRGPQSRDSTDGQHGVRAAPPRTTSPVIPRSPAW
jgi:hypothetical protein